MDYFDLSNRADTPATTSTAEEMPVWEQVLMYFIVVAAVILSAGVAQAREGTPITLDLGWPWVLVAALIALMAFPAVWKSLGSRADSPLLVRIGIGRSC